MSKSVDVKLSDVELGLIESLLEETIENLEDQQDNSYLPTNYASVRKGDIRSFHERIHGVLDQLVFGCVDCQVNTNEIGEYYSVKDSVWATGGLGPHDGMLCLGCLEKRIWRRLTPKDFTDAPINSFSGLSDRFLDRLGRKKAA